MRNGHRVVVLGAGYAGLVAAKRLARRICPGGASVTLVDARPEFVERIRLHQVAAGQAVAALPLAEVLAGSGARVVVGRVTGVDLAARAVRVGDQEIGYDTLVYGLGSVTEVDGVPGVAEHAAVLSGPAEARRLAGRLSALADRGGVAAVCGGGPTGVELAAELAESYPGLAVRLLTRGEPGGWLSPRAARYLRRRLDRMGVAVTAGAEVSRVEPDAVALADGVRVPADLVLWTGGFTVPPLAREAGLAVNGRGRVLVDQTLRSVSHPEVHAIGDAAAVPGPWGAEIAYGCRSGGFTGPYVADAIATRLAGGVPRPFRFRYFHQCLSLGRRAGVIQFVDGADESPQWMILRGRIAAGYKEIVCRSSVWLFRHPGPYLPRVLVPPRPAKRP
ncbi:NAD(P)/FAD-dependent oxidoreductase [Actinokineospora iranica]|uniref:NADH dehydrogenase, FAD-containing subunit n=1 Tax=Actinokineospora iranica TaxID=1271860 RepID=A0A1G6S4Y4_9PSEU|nr:FAD-dependent oxidoreductase [Actinokineospora iranica]SDD11908.1 NADH dehydrogenase, FAD-containing subunit [Actinokineospora iranica]